jgi:uncharacterized membrane protein YeaQ/YmgE (transglycosylase-associated protein family)
MLVDLLLRKLPPGETIPFEIEHQVFASLQDEFLPHMNPATRCASVRERKARTVPLLAARDPRARIRLQVIRTFPRHESWDSAIGGDEGNYPGSRENLALILSITSVGGSIVAGFIGRSLAWYTEGAPVGFCASVIGAILLLAVYRPVTGSRHRVGA